jgi:hypothetical protein
MVMLGNNVAESAMSEAYADNLTIIFKMSNEGVGVILELLREFETVSGLSININKTQLMISGSEQWGIGTKIHDVVIVGEVTILGIKIDRKLEQLRENWDKAILRMQRLTNYWSMFGLSISGRVMVAKTYIMSQSIYLMGSIPMDENIGNRMNEVLLNFIKGRDRLIERRRQLLHTELEGYGMVDMNIMNACMKASWIERWKRESTNIDYMAAVVWKNIQDMDVNDIKLEHVTGKGFPIMEDILEAWLKFKKKYYEWVNNINRAVLFGNEAILGIGRTVEGTVFGRERILEIGGRVSEGLVRDICDLEGRILDKVLVEQNLGANISWVRC